MEDEGLARVLRGLGGDGELCAGRLDVAQRDQRGDAPLGRLRLDLDVSELSRELARLAEHLERVGQARRRRARPVDAHQRLREPAAVVDTARHRDRLRAHRRGALRAALELERPREAREHAHTKRRVALSESLQGLVEELARAHLGAGPGASSSSRSRSPRVRAARPRRARERSPPPRGRRRATRASAPRRTARCPGRAASRRGRSGRRAPAAAPCAAAPPPRRTRALPTPLWRRAGCSRRRAPIPRSAQPRRSGARGRRGRVHDGAPRSPPAPRRSAGAARRGAARSGGRTARGGRARG